MNGTYNSINPWDPLLSLLSSFSSYLFKEPRKLDSNPHLSPEYKALHDKIVIEFLTNCERISNNERELNQIPRVYTIIFLQLASWKEINKKFTRIKLDENNPPQVKQWAEGWIDRISKMRQVRQEIRLLARERKTAELDKANKRLKQLLGAGEKDLLDLQKTSCDGKCIASTWPASCQKLIQLMEMNWARLNAFTIKPEEFSMNSQKVEVYIESDTYRLDKNISNVDSAFRAIFQIEETDLFADEAQYTTQTYTVVQPVDIRLSTCGFPKQTLTQVIHAEILKALLPVNRIYYQPGANKENEANKENRLSRTLSLVWHDELPIDREDCEPRDETSIKIARTVDRAIATIRDKLKKGELTYDPETEQQTPRAMLGGGTSVVLSPRKKRYV